MKAAASFVALFTVAAVVADCLGRPASRAVGSCEDRSWERMPPSTDVEATESLPDVETVVDGRLVGRRRLPCCLRGTRP